MDIHWDAVFRAAKYHNNIIDPTKQGLQAWMLDTWGVEHLSESIRIVDEQKYMLLLLRWGA